jgi:hypothetical protein
VRWPTFHNHQHLFNFNNFSEVLHDHKVVNLWQYLVKESIPDFWFLISDSPDNIELPNLQYYLAQDKVSLDRHAFFLAFYQGERLMHRLHQ